MKTVASSKAFSSSLFYLQLLLPVTHYVDSQPTNVLIIKSEKQQTRYNELVNTHQGYPVTLFYACTPCFFIDKMQVEQKFLSHCSEPRGPCWNAVSAWAGLECAILPLHLWWYGWTSLGVAGQEEGVQRSPMVCNTSPPPHSPAASKREAGSYIHCTGGPLALPASSPLWSGLFCPSSRINLSQNEQGQGHSFGDCWEAPWMGSPQIVDNYFVCLNKAGAAKMALANKSVTYRPFISGTC